MTSTTKALASLGSALASSRLSRTMGGLDADHLLSWAGLARRRGGFWKCAGWFGAGAAVGAAAALLLAPSTGRDTRRRLKEGAGRLGDAAESKWNHATAELLERRDQVLSEIQALDDRGAAIPPTPPVTTSRNPIG